MKKLKFTGDHTNGRKSIKLFGVEFKGHEATSVTNDVFEQLKDHPEFAEVKPRKKTDDDA